MLSDRRECAVETKPSRPRMLRLLFMLQKGRKRKSIKMIKLIDVTPDNWRTRLQTSEEQKRYVANTAVLLARAYAYREQRSRAFIVYSDETPVGMGLYYDLPDMECYDLSQFFIDERYQGQGLGRAASMAILNAMREDGKYQKVALCYVEGNETAQRLYESLGFCETDRDGDEIGMELIL